MNGLRIVAAGGLALEAGETPEALAPLFAALGRKPPRRSSRFDQLALLGALRAVNTELAEDSALYLATGQGNVADTAALLEGLYRRHEAPMPVGFINVSSNLAGFQTAAALGLHGPNLTVSRHDFAFGAALELALADARGGRLRQGLIGGVDAGSWPLGAQRQRLHVAADTPLGEGSHWLVIDQAAAAPLALIEEVRSLPDREAALAYVRALPSDIRLVTRDAAFARDTGRECWQPASAPAGHYETAAAQPLCQALQNLRGRGVQLESGRDGSWQAIRFS